MNLNNTSPLLKSTMSPFQKNLNEDHNYLYFASNTVDFSHNTLHDGFRIVNTRKKYFLLLEKLHMEEYLKRNNINYENKEFVTYKANFLKNSDTHSSGTIHVLGRYFSKNYRPHLANDSPRKKLSTDIYSNKNNFSTFLEWDSPIVNSLNLNWNNLLQELISSREQENKIIVTSIPNADGKNRFSSFLKKMKTHSGNNVVYIDNLFTQTKKVNTFKQPYAEKMKNLNKIYKVNPLMETLFEENSQIVIIDDVITSGAHFEQCLMALSESKIKSNYQVHGIFLAATQSNHTNWETGLEYTDSQFLLHTN
jgi:hypothetical protein